MSAGGRVELALGNEGQRLGLSWELDLLRSLAGQAKGDASPWSLDREPGEAGLVRVVSAGLEDETAVGVAALRPRASGGHGDEEVAGFIARPGRDPVEIPEALISTEYDHEGRVRRAGLELWLRETGPPARGAGDRTGTSEVRRGGLAGESVRMDFRFDGVAGAAVYELLKPAG